MWREGRCEDGRSSSAAPHGGRACGSGRGSAGVAVEVLLAVSGGAGQARWSGGEDVVVVERASGSCQWRGRSAGRLERTEIWDLAVFAK